MAVWSEVKASTLSLHSSRIDSEYYRPETLAAEQLVNNVNSVKFGKLVTDGYRVVYENTKILRSDKVTLLDCKFLQATNISQDGLSIDVDGVGYVSESDWKRYPKGRISKGELLIEVKGQAEKVTIVPDNYPERTLVSGSLFKASLSSTVSAEYVFTFFNSKYGKLLRDRTKTNTLIAFVSKPELYKIPIPVPNKEIHDNITKAVKNSIFKNNLSKSLYTQAHELLEKELGLDQLVLERPKSYETSFSEVVSGGRIDSDYFQVHFKQQANHLSMIQSKPLRELVDFQKGIEVGSPAYTSSGKLFVRVSNVKKTGVVTGNSDKYISETLFKCLESYQPKIGDILLTKDGTVGVCYVVDKTVDGIISGGIMKLSKKDESIPSEYLALVINSPICQFQIDRDCSGALIVHWKPKDIAALKIPILKQDKMAELSDLVNQSKIAKKESEQLLDRAKRMVEELIEGAV
ncbi:restriction endonuclease subunit S [Vibrio diazotrophicus]|uniref:restriction endonuclease subunit S n=1 Tax=Vibrio diazotrophicus TaxID=685 RepID=UPI000C9E0C0E|nr:restriction endonuclease subunit S [Vibrio diazotrophicus]PNH91511.1 hypothetical protein C1M59_14390 [Vibrio diazotrophicus]